MSFSVKKVNAVQIQVDPETAALIAALLLKVSWSQFPVAEELREELFNSDSVEDEVDLTWDEENGEFVKAE